MSWLPTKLPPNCKIIVSCTKEDNNPILSQDYELLLKMIDGKYFYEYLIMLVIVWKIPKLRCHQGLPVSWNTLKKANNGHKT